MLSYLAIWEQVVMVVHDIGWWIVDYYMLQVILFLWSINFQTRSICLNLGQFASN